jgi:hypothetical protein
VTARSPGALTDPVRATVGQAQPATRPMNLLSPCRARHIHYRAGRDPAGGHDPIPARPAGTAVPNARTGARTISNGPDVRTICTPNPLVFDVTPRRVSHPPTRTCRRSRPEPQLRRRRRRLHDQVRLRRRRRRAQQNIADQQRVLGPDHHDTLSSRNNLDRARAERDGRPPIR